MKTIMLTTLAAAVLSAATFATASANNNVSLSAKVMAEHPGTISGRTVDPTARPDNGIGQYIKVNSTQGGTVAPLAKVDNGTIHSKVRLN